MAFDMFLELPTPAQTSGGAVKAAGESLDKAHPNTIEISAFSFGLENPSSIGSATGGAGAGKARFNTLEITKHVDSSTVALFNVLGTGAHFPDAALYIRKAGGPTTGPATDYLVYRFKMLFITDLNWQASSGDEQPQETLKCAYGAMQITYTSQSPTGAPSKPPVTFSWNQVVNSPDFNVPGN